MFRKQSAKRVSTLKKKIPIKRVLGKSKAVKPKMASRNYTETQPFNLLASTTLMKYYKTNILNIEIYSYEDHHVVLNPVCADIAGLTYKPYTQIIHDNIDLRKFLENSYGDTFTKKAKNLFKSRLNKDLNQDLFETALNKFLLNFRSDCALESTYSIDNWAKERCKALYKRIFQKACSETYLEHYRTELSEWINHYEKGKALFVDCLMGVGKTYSIIKTLAEKSNISAVVFLPTNKLCREIVQKLKIEILQKNPVLKDKYHGVPERSETEYDVDDYFGYEIYHYHRDYLKYEVYHADGINKEECPKFEEIIGRYKKNWINKKSVCKECDRGNYCRFQRHYENASKARIIVTTHQQYDHFYHNDILHTWDINGDKRPRDLFIIDEDLVFSQLYRPINLEYTEIRAFIQTITCYIEKNEEISGMRESIDLLFSQISKCDKTSVIRAINPDFKFPEKFVKEWEMSLPEQPFVKPEYIQWSGIVGNHLKVIEHAVRFGAVVEKWGNRFKIHFPNPRSYDLSNVPPHVFFDGTMLSEKFLKKKLSGVEFKKLRIDIKFPWDIRVFQNINSDLPERWINRDKPKVKDFLKSISDKISSDRKIFLITTNAIKKAYLDEFIKNELRDRWIAYGYYGNIRGINDAKECDVGIMLGSFMPSDSIEIAMALEFINPDDLETDITLTQNNLWTWSDTNGVRTYRDNFIVIGEMAKAYRHSEHRQALARTRYLFHDVDFYIISKDKVSDYEPFLSNIVDDQYREDLFQPRPKRPEEQQKFNEVKAKVLEWLKTHDTVYAQQIYDQYGIRGKTVAKKLKEMFEKGLLVLDSGKKTTYRLPNRN